MIGTEIAYVAAMASSIIKLAKRLKASCKNVGFARAASGGGVRRIAVARYGVIVVKRQPHQ